MWHMQPLEREHLEDLTTMSVEFEGFLDQWRKKPLNISVDFVRERFMRDGFGENPSFEGIIATTPEGAAAGFMLFHNGYNMDIRERVVYVIDLLSPSAS